MVIVMMRGDRMRAKTCSAGVAAAIALAAGFPAAASAQPMRRPESFTVIVVGNAPQLFIARGAINATGTAVRLTRGGTSGGTDQVELPGGTFRLTLHNTSGGGGRPRPPTCIATFHAAGNSTIFDGAGSFAGIAGGGTCTSHGVFFATRTAHGCSHHGTDIVIVHDHGTVTLG
jgi:hypothetical protein